MDLGFLKKSGQLSSSFPRTPHCVSLSFPHWNQCFFIVLSLQSFRRAKKKRSLARSHSSSSGEFREAYTFCALRSEREGFCERCIQYKVRVERLTKIQIESSWDKRASLSHYRCFLRAFWSSNDRSQWYTREVFHLRWRWRRKMIISTWIFQWDWHQSIHQRTGNRIQKITQSSHRSISSSLARTIAARIT